MSGSVVSLTAVADAGASFVGWSGDVSGTAASVDVTVGSAPVAVTATFTDAPPPPDPEAEIDVWYGSSQEFGANGIPQRWVQILGNASDTDGVASLTYRLNGGAPQGLEIGPDNRRLEYAGDFNVEIDRADLNTGANTVEITMTDSLGNQTVENVTVTWTPTTLAAPTSPTTIDWSSGDLDDLVQIVDGKWDVNPAGQLHTTEVGYDRVVAIGDESWTDYEVEVPFTIDAIGPRAGAPLSGDPLVGFGLRWNGHGETGTQPNWGFWPTGAFGWYTLERGGRLELLANNGSPADFFNGITLQLGTTYVMKAQVEDVTGGTAYRFKVWEQGTAEPGWQTEVIDTEGDLVTSGSILLIAHHFDIRFDDLMIRPVP
ncbi:MAG: hypothetical protein AAGA17_19925 [Actinomycetota bacterium]